MRSRNGLVQLLLCAIPLDPMQIGKTLGEEWRAMSEAEKGKYK